jgi:drug/metabolite transporter (DMT)-like permease
VYAALVATTMGWGGSFVAIKQALHYLTPLQLVWMRFVPASLVFLLLLGLRERQAVWALGRAEWRSLTVMGLLGVVVYHMALNTGEQLIPAGTASLVIALNPAFVVLLSALFLRERVDWMQVLGLALAFWGLFVIVRYASGGQVDFRYLQGVLITVAAPLAWAGYTVLSRPLSKRYPALAITGAATFFGTLPILLTTRSELLSRIATLPWDGWLSVLYLALICTVAGFTVWNAALRHLEASQAGSFVYLSPLWGVVFSQVLLHEPMNPALFLGAAIVFGGVALVNRRHRPEAASDKSQ